MFVAILFLLFTATAAMADTEIHRCLLDDGTVAFQETPCPEPAGNIGDENKASDARSTGETPADDNYSPDFSSPFDEPEASATPPEPRRPAPMSQNRAECEKTARDAIDAIDVELQKKANSKDKGQEHLAELLRLTEQLRACKQL